ncbi:5'-3' exonuclease PLD3 [Folsomia candida]|uniref:Phospholipase D3 n=1 Tax=Folsomia candida TaxID=158441 RepID=A0A226EL77_FOLCA|nr:5'-3' exonuclease PLD3 [Folsomia candida]OXA58455.1 Phospholipase D3 [Folsomia candida]
MPMFSLDFGVRKDSSKSSFSRSSIDSIDSLSGSLKKSFGQPHYKSAVEASGKLDFGELELELHDARYMLRGYKEKNQCEGWCKPSCIPITIILILIILVVVLSLIDQNQIENATREQIRLKKDWAKCRKECRLDLLESIPEGLTFNSTTTHSSTYSGWVQLLELAKESIEIGSFYWNLVDDSIAPEYTEEGRDIYQRLLEAGTTRGIKIKIAQNIASDQYPNLDTLNLKNAKAAEVRSLDFDRLVGSGVLHTKMWVVDRTHVYVGSANFDWKSLTQVKELGILATNCTCFAKDLGKVFDVYWKLGENNSKVPDKWPSSYATIYNKDNPMDISFNGEKYSSYLSSAPSQFNPKGRTFDLDAIQDVITNATKFIDIAVMDYSPSLLYSHPPKFWPIIDNALRSAAIDRGVSVRLLISQWDHTRNSTYKFLKSLQDINNVYQNVDVQVKLFKVPATPAQKLIPFARVNHNKYMVTDNSAFIGTSNWSGDYFTGTAGVGFVVTRNNKSDVDSDNDIRSQVAQIFKRDWNSDYAKYL